MKALGRPAFLKLFKRSNSLISDFYFALGKMYFRHQATPVRDEDFSSDQGESDDKNEGFDEAWFLLLTASTIGHKQARAYLSLMMENGLIPSGQVYAELAGPGKRFEYLAHLSNLKEFVKPDSYSMAEFKQEMQSKALINLYLSSLSDLGAKP
jgi:hypothetical protein